MCLIIKGLEIVSMQSLILPVSTYTFYHVFRGCYQGYKDAEQLRSENFSTLQATPSPNDLLINEACLPALGLGTASYSMISLLPSFSYSEILHQGITAGFQPIFYWLGTTISNNWLHVALDKQKKVGKDYSQLSSGLLPYWTPKRIDPSSCANYDKRLENACAHNYIVLNENQSVYTRFYLEHEVTSQSQPRSQSLYRVDVEEKADSSAALSFSTANHLEAAYARTYSHINGLEIEKFNGEEFPEKLSEYLTDKRKVFIEQKAQSSLPSFINSLKNNQNLPDCLNNTSDKLQFVTNPKTQKKSFNYFLKNGFECTIYFNNLDTSRIEIQFRKLSWFERLLRLFSKRFSFKDIKSKILELHHNPQLNLSVSSPKAGSVLKSFLQDCRKDKNLTKTEIIQIGKRRIENAQDDPSLKVFSIFDSNDAPFADTEEHPVTYLHFTTISKINFIKRALYDGFKSLKASLIDDVKLNKPGKFFGGLYTLIFAPFSLTSTLVGESAFLIINPLASLKARETLILGKKIQHFDDEKIVDFKPVQSPKPSLWDRVVRQFTNTQPGNDVSPPRSPRQVTVRIG